MILDLLLKIIFHRQRPSFDDSYLVFYGYSFPSGHTIAATLLYGLLAVFTVIVLETWLWRVGAVLNAIAMILLIGFSRVYLGAHYLSDVLGAVAAGFAWLAFSLTAVDTLRRNRVHLGLASLSTRRQNRSGTSKASRKLGPTGRHGQCMAAVWQLIRDLDLGISEESHARVCIA